LDDPSFPTFECDFSVKFVGIDDHSRDEVLPSVAIDPKPGSPTTLGESIDSLLPNKPCLVRESSGMVLDASENMGSGKRWLNSF
jgi:hypothetical protein